MCQYPNHQIRAKSKGLLTLFSRVVMSFRIRSAVARIGFVCVIHDQTSVPEYAKPLWRLSVLFVGLGRTGGELKLTVGESIIKGQLN